MTVLKEYRGHIRNWRELCSELGIDSTLPRDEREKEIVVKAYEKWGTQVADHFYGMFAFACAINSAQSPSIITRLPTADCSTARLSAASWSSTAS